MPQVVSGWRSSRCCGERSTTAAPSTGPQPFPGCVIEGSLQELADQLLTPPVQLAFEFALTHLLGFGRTEEGFGLSEGGLGCCTRRLVGGNVAVGHGSRRSTLRQPLPSHVPRTWSSLRPSQRHPLSHRNVPKRRANVQGDGPEGQTGAPRRRDQAGLAALAAREQAGANAVPPYGVPKRAPASENAYEQGGKRSTKKSRTQALSKNLDYYRNYNTITQNSAGSIYFECADNWVHIYVDNRFNSVDFRVS